ncbi:protein STRUBBELIG-RECEPTOR FAMILY 3 [Anabas testudineus]|uniref:Uncharacterized protein n=1 Tax=Anabas testudineus TaxID=64144 RepID=A0A3Q1KGJ7_ANATE|nr:protein STRUBBELIG-RECEPTOR FAMILY 3 [Anabas testudineus]
MAVSMWRMNGLWRRMTEVLVLSALLLSNDVICQTVEATNANTAPATNTTPGPTAATSSVNAGPNPEVTTILPLSATISPSKSSPTIVGAGAHNEGDGGVSPKKEAPEMTKSEASPGSSSGSSSVSSSGSPSGSPSGSSSGSSVFVGILVTGLLAALAIIVGYFKCQRRSDTKGEKLAEEAYPVDQENQGNTLVSVAPLNPPPENQEKPSINGESTEPAKTEPPPASNNGHSTAKTADTEL